ncbi:MAG: hypothetical protein ACRDV9_14545, partial [Acidimicrobiia bacterium]
PGPYSIVNNFLEAWFNNLFTGGGSMWTPNTATLTASTATTATMSTVANLSVGDVVAFKMPAPFTNASGYPTSWGNAQITGISGATVTFTGVGPDAIPSAPAVPGVARWNGVNVSNVEVRRNTFNKRPEWSKYGQMKSYWQMKSGANMIFDGNIVQGFNGDSLSLTAGNQDGDSPWGTVKNVTIINNYFKGTGHIIVNLTGPYHTSVPGENVLIHNNLMTGNLDKLYMAQGSGGSNVTITHNTVGGITSNSMLFWVTPTPGMVVKDNIFKSGSYWFNCTIDGKLSTCWPGMVQDHNVLVNTSGNAPPSYTSTDFVVTNDAAVGFVNVTDADAGGDYHGYALASTSPFKGRASDGTDPGVNFAVLDAALSSSGSAGALSWSGSSGPRAPSNLQVR